MTDWLDSRHSFSYGPHYDPANTHFGLLLVNNDDRVRGGGGFDMHPHRDTEIITWVLEGALEHRDSAGNHGIVRPGLAQRMSAGSGIRHAERNASDVQDVRFVQMWVLPDVDNGTPEYEQCDLGRTLDERPVVVASGMARHRTERAVALRQRNAALHAARLRPGATWSIPAAPFVHLFVVRGDLRLEGVRSDGADHPGVGRVEADLITVGDAVRILDGDGQRVTAGPSGVEALVWEMYATLR